MRAQALIRRVPVGESVVEAILRLVRAGRPGETDVEFDQHLRHDLLAQRHHVKNHCVLQRAAIRRTLEPERQCEGRKHGGNLRKSRLLQVGPDNFDAHPATP